MTERVATEAIRRRPDRLSNTRLRDLDASRRRLVELIMDIHFGSIHGMVIRHGTPDWTFPVTVTREVKFPRDSEQRRVRWSEEVPLKVQFTELFDELRGQPDGTSVSIEIKGSLPFRLFVVGAE